MLLRGVKGKLKGGCFYFERVAYRGWFGWVLIGESWFYTSYLMLMHMIATLVWRSWGSEQYWGYIPYISIVSISIISFGALRETIPLRVWLDRYLRKKTSTLYYFHMDAFIISIWMPAPQDQFKFLKNKYLWIQICFSNNIMFHSWAFMSNYGDTIHLKFLFPLCFFNKNK